ETYTDAGVYTQVLTAFNSCDSTITLTLEVLPIASSGIAASICSGDTYDFDGDILTDAGTYTHVYTAFNGCDSTVTLTLDVLPVQSTTLDINICEGETYTFDGVELDVAGTYTAVYTGVNGCDSTVTLNLDVLPVSASAFEAIICDNEVFPFNGQALTDAGTYTAVLPAFNGCDSTITFTLIVWPTSATEIEATICANETYEFNGETYNQTGTYTAVLPAFNGCDSTITLNLSVLPLAETNLALNLCEGVSYDFNGQTLTQDGVYTAVLTAFNGCDSTVNLQLDFVPFFADFIITSICEGESYTFGGQDITQSGEYVQNLVSVGGCDSTVTLILTVNPVAVTNLAVDICDGETYSFNGLDLDQAGTYTASFQTVAGCDSTVNLTLAILPNSVSSVEASICDGEVYGFNGLILTQAGTYTASITSFNGCDSTITLTLNVLPLAATTLAASICDGEAYDFNGMALTVAGTYTDVLTAFNGCDSTVTLSLNVLPLSSSQITAQICDGDTYAFNGQALEQSGTYAGIFTGFNGCDSTVTLVLTVATELTTELNAAICEGEMYTFDGTDLDTEGSYTFVYTAQGGCDSTVTLNLSVFPNVSTNLEVNICAGETYPFNGQVLDQSGNYTALLNTVNGCDSTVNLVLTVLPTYTGELNASTCNGDPFEYGGSVLNQSGSYQFTLTAANGCDSMVTVNLTIYQDIPPTVIIAEICQGESYEFFGETLVMGGTYTEILETPAGCDSIIGLLLTVLPNLTTTLNESLCEGDSAFFNGNFVSAPGVYTAELTAFNGCDSTVTLTLTVTPVDNGLTLSGNTLTSSAQNADYLWIDCATGFPVNGATGQSFTPEASGSYAVFVTQNGCSRLSDCVQVIGTATNEPENGIVWQLSPNPAVSETNIRFEQPLRSDCTIELVDASGKILRTEHIAQGATFVILELTNMPEGMLFVRLNDGQNIVIKRLVKATR
ncbi:MAG: T9SS type A sorting domain-containing protein, partial [Saprospiraceae bacterium]|nr:T9SS type A sorting domain-containing protein [Saprospiraceae bacterium]